MRQRQHDGLTLAVTLGLLSLGIVMLYYTLRGQGSGNLFFPLPAEPFWLVTMLRWQETAVFSALVFAVGALYGGYFLYWPPTQPAARVRVWVGWLTLALLWDLTLYRAVGFWTAQNPPWWAVLWLGAVTVALTVRRIGDLYTGGLGHDA